MEILKHPDVFLKQQSTEVKLPLTDADLKLIKEMKETMYANDGIGLAGIQVGHQKRMAIIDTSRSQENCFAIINPIVISASNEHMQITEGCLSTPNKVGYPRRNKWIKVEYSCEHGKRQCKTFYDLKAECIQHEIDHMDGKLCIDYGQDAT